MPKFLVPIIQPQAIIDEKKAPTFAFQRWLETVQQWLSNKGAPLTDADPGVPLQIQGLEVDSTFTYLYICVAPNTWRRVPLQDF